MWDCSDGGFDSAIHEPVNDLRKIDNLIAKTAHVNKQFNLRCYSNYVVCFCRVNVTGDDQPVPKSVYDECNTNCSCSTYTFDPVCANGEIQYFNPCFAGCSKEMTYQDEKVFRAPSAKSTNIRLTSRTNQVSQDTIFSITSSSSQTWYILLFQIYYDCTCIAISLHTNSSVVQYPSDIPLGWDGNQGYATSGPCSTQCHVIYVFTGMMILTCLTTFMAGIAAQTATIRSVCQHCHKP